MAKTSETQAVSIDNANKRMELHSIHLKNYVLWKDQKLDIEEGITRISGLNRSGKTLFVNGLRQAFQGSATGKRGTTASKMPVKSQVGVEFQKGDTKYSLSVTPSSIRLAKNGEDMGLRGVTAPRQTLTDLVSIPNSLYDATVHITTKQHPLSHNTPSGRMQWIGDVFNINAPFDALLKKVEKRYAKVKDAGSISGSVKQQLKEIHIPSKPMDAALLKEEIDVNRERLAKATKELQRREHEQTIRDKITVSQPVATLDHLIEKFNKAIKKYESHSKKLDAYEDYLSNKKKHGKLVKEYQTTIEELKGKDSFSGSDKSLKSKEAKLLVQYESMVGDAERWEDESEIRKVLKKGFDGDLLPLKQLAKLAAGLRHEQSTIKLALTALDHEKGGQCCPTCRTRLSPDKQNKLLKRYKARLKAIKAEMLNLSACEEHYELESQITVKKRPKIEPVIKEIKTIRKVLKARETLRLAESKLEELKKNKPTEVAKPDDVVDDLGVVVTNVSKKIKELREDLSVLKTDRALTESLAKLPKPSKELGKSKDSSLKVLQATLKETLIELERSYTESLRVETIRSEAIQLKRHLKAQLKDLKKQSSLAKRLQLLKEAFGPKGMRLVKIKQAIETFVDQLNAQTSLVWGEPFKFIAEISDDGFNLIAERNGISGDLTTLSGSEDKCWRSLCAMVLIRMLPDAHRADYVILDEVESNLDAESRYLYARDFIPELQTIVPKVIVVSPLNDREFGVISDREYQVTKKNGTSKLVKIK